MEDQKTYYVVIKTEPHMGCVAVPTGKVWNEIVECHVVFCRHGDKKLFITREDI